MKKLIMSCAVAGAFAALVIAPAASASPTLTQFGQKIPIGVSLKNKATGSPKFTGSFGIECSSAEFNGTVTKNTGTAVAVEIPSGISFSGTASGGDCTSALGATKVSIAGKLCLEAVSGDTVTLKGCSGSVVASFELTGTGVCKYSATSLSGTLATSASTVNFAEQEAKKTEGGIFCPASGKIDLDTDMTTTEGAPVTWS